MAENTDLYRYFDSDQKLLYVGISYSAIKRSFNHGKVAPWWLEVRSMTVTRLPTREDAEAAEKQAIQTECPRYNDKHSVRDDKPPRAEPHKKSHRARSAYTKFLRTGLAAQALREFDRTAATLFTPEQLMEDEVWVDPPVATRLTGLSDQKLKYLRYQDKGIPYIKVALSRNGQVKYPLSWLRRFVESPDKVQDLQKTKIRGFTIAQVSDEPLRMGRWAAYLAIQQGISPVFPLPAHVI